MRQFNRHQERAEKAAEGKAIEHECARALAAGLKPEKVAQLRDLWMNNIDRSPREQFKAMQRFGMAAVSRTAAKSYRLIPKAAMRRRNASKRSSKISEAKPRQITEDPLGGPAGPIPNSPAPNRTTT
jgi:hypothetical protein